MHYDQSKVTLGYDHYDREAAFRRRIKQQKKQIQTNETLPDNY